MKEKNTYNRIYTDEKWESVNKYNKSLMNDFLLELKSQKKKESTLKQYKNDLRILFIYILEELDNKPIHKLNKKSFRNYSLWLSTECNMSNARVNRLLSALRSMLSYATDDEDYSDDIEINYAAKVKGLQKESVRDIIFLSMDEVDYLYNYLIEHKKYQQATLLGLMVDSACRRNEAYQVEKSSITEDGAFTNVVVGKRGKKFRLLYNDMTKKAFKLYMEQRGEDDVESLWVTKEDGKVKKASYESLYNWVRCWRPIIEDYSGVYKPFNAHSFRHIALELLSTGDHYICKKLGKEKFELRELQLLANHSDISTTASYLADKSEDELLAAFGLK